MTSGARASETGQARVTEFGWLFIPGEEEQRYQAFQEEKHKSSLQQGLFWSESGGMNGVTVAHVA